MNVLANNNTSELPSNFTRTRGQSGLVLVIGLIFLLLLTIIGVSAVQNSTLQERMAGNSDDRNLAFQSAEVALQNGEAEIDSACASLNSLVSAIPDPDAATWAGAVDVNISDFTGQYVISRMPLIKNDESEVPVDPNICDGFYMVTSRSTSVKGMTVVLQSTVVKRF